MILLCRLFFIVLNLGDREEKKDWKKKDFPKIKNIIFYSNENDLLYERDVNFIAGFACPFVKRKMFSNGRVSNWSYI